MMFVINLLSCLYYIKKKKFIRKKNPNVEGGEDQMGKFPSKHFLPHFLPNLGRKQNTPKWWGTGVLFSIFPISPPPPNKLGKYSKSPLFSPHLPPPKISPIKQGLKDYTLLFLVLISANI